MKSKQDEILPDLSHFRLKIYFLYKAFWVDRIEYKKSQKENQVSLDGDVSEAVLP
jgi:hypothetical protein